MNYQSSKAFVKWLQFTNIFHRVYILLHIPTIFIHQYLYLYLQYTRFFFTIFSPLSLSHSHLTHLIFFPIQNIFLSTSTHAFNSSHNDFQYYVVIKAVLASSICSLLQPFLLPVFLIFFLFSFFYCVLKHSSCWVTWQENPIMCLAF